MTKKDLRELIMSPAAIAEMDQRIKLKKIEEEVERAERKARINENLKRFLKVHKMLVYPNTEKNYNHKTNYFSNEYNLQYSY
jgi:predicted nucleic acid-binding protein